MLFTKRQVMYVSRATARAMSAEMPIGDPYGGPAYGQKEDWGTAISVGGSLLGGVLSNDASSDAANTQASAANSAAQLEAQAAQRALEEQKRQFDLSRSDLAPWKNTGNAALDQLSLMTGIYPQSQRLSSLGSMGGSMGDYKAVNSPDLIDTSKGGAFNPNADLYASSPEYKAAYDKFMGWHQSRYGKSPNLSLGSDEQIAEKQIQDFGFNLGNYNTNKKTSYDKNLQDNSAAAQAKQDAYSFASTDPSYAFRQSEGNKGIEAALRARGMYGSGGALKELTEYNSNLASTEYGNQFGRLSTLAGYGQNATNSGNTLGAQYAANAGNIGINSAANSGNALLAGANARASGYVNSANNWGNTLGNVGGTLADYYKRNGSGGSGSESYPWNYNW